MARVVAELGRPETPDETAARKAESSRIYRSSQNFRNLIAAIIATLAVVLIIIAIVPRGEPAKRPPIDVPGIAAKLEASMDTTLVVPEVPTTWSVNDARVQQGVPPVWNIVYAPGASAFIRLAQGVGADPGWADRLLVGGRAGDTITLDGVVWTEYEFRDTTNARNVTYALTTQAGADAIAVYGSANTEIAQTFASSLSAQLLDMTEAAR